MTSTNFEFIRSRWPHLADDAASAERELHKNKRSAMRDLRTFCEAMLKEHFQRKGSVALGKLLQDPEAELPRELKNRLDYIPSRGNKSSHYELGIPPVEIDTDEALKHLKTAFDLAVWIVTELDGKRPDVEFVEPPRGGRELDEAMKLIGKRPQDLRGWIKSAMNGPFTFTDDDSFIGRSVLIRDVCSRLHAGDQRILIVGEPGRGKTRLLKELFERGIFAEAGTTLPYFFVSTSSGDRRGWLKHFYASLLDHFNLKENDPAIERADADDLLNRLCGCLTEICNSDQSPRVVLVIDAIDEAGDAEPAVLDFVSNRLPALSQQITVVATVRPGHLPESESPDVIDLEDADRVNGHRVDGRAYVNDRLNEQTIPQTLKDQVAQIGNGNFRALYHICQRIPKIRPHEGIREYLNQLSSSQDVLTGIYEEWWRRVERQVGPDDLEKLLQMVALIASAAVPLNRKIVQRILKPRQRDWRAFEQCLTEYLTITDREAPNDGKPEQTAKVFRFYHATFSAFIRAEFPREIQTAQAQLADFCIDWKSRSDEWYSHDYALRFAVHHSTQQERWPDLVNLLTDLHFIQARFRSEQGYELLTDFDDVLKLHPESRERVQRRFEASRQWVQELVDYSRACTAIRDGHTTGQLPNPINEISRLKFPEPPGTREAERLMREADFESHAPAAVESTRSDFERLSEYRSFANRWFHYLAAFPNLTISIARKHGTAGIVDAAGSDGEPLDHLRRTRPWIPLRSHSLFVHEFVDPNHDLEESRYGGMTKDAAIVFGAPCVQDTHFWDTRSGMRCKPYADLLCISSNGTYAVTKSEGSHSQAPSSIQLVSLPDGDVVAELKDVNPVKYWPENNLAWTISAQLTPDASVLVFIDGHDSNETLTTLHIWHPFADSIRHFIIDDLTPHHAWVTPSGTVAAVYGHIDGNSVWRLFDLLKNAVIADVPGHEIREFINEEWYSNELSMALQLQRPLSSIDGRVKIRQDTQDCMGPESGRVSGVEVLVDERVVRSFGPSRPFISILGLSADGRLAFAETTEFFALIDLAEGVWKEPAALDSLTSVATAPNEVRSQEAEGCLSRTTNEEAAAVTEMGLTADPWTIGDDGELLTGEARSSLAHAEFVPHSWYKLDDDHVSTDGEKDDQLPRSHFSGLRRSSDGQVLCAWLKEWDAIPTLDGTRWSLSKPEKSASFKQGATRTHPDPVILPADDSAHIVLDIVTGRSISLSDAAKTVAWTSDGSNLIAADPGTGLRFWNRTTSAWIHDLAIREDAVSAIWQRVEERSNFEPFVQVSPDGRHVAWADWYGPPVVVKLSTGAVTPFPDVNWVRSDEISFSPDGRYVLTAYWVQSGCTSGQFLWNVETGECLDLIGDDRDYCEVELATPEPIVPWVTGIRMFRPEIGSPIGNLTEPLYPDGHIPGRFDDDITFRCRRCQQWSPLPASIQSAIASIHKAARLSKEDSPVLHLPTGAWDRESQLKFECPQCNQPHKSTPFVVDRRSEL